jgi:hypothetical protein
MSKIKDLPKIPKIEKQHKTTNYSEEIEELIRDKRIEGILKFYNELKEENTALKRYNEQQTRLLIKQNEREEKQQQEIDDLKKSKKLLSHMFDNLKNRVEFDEYLVNKAYGEVKDKLNGWAKKFTEQEEKLAEFEKKPNTRSRSRGEK